VGRVAENFRNFSKEIPDNVKIVAVSKLRQLSDIEDVYGTGHKVFGENRVQELTGKAESMPDDVEWHMIGHLQSNKAKFICPFISMIHSVDSLKLLKIVNEEAGRNSRTIDCLLQMHIADEETKYGFSEEELHSLLESTSIKDFKNISIKGLMAMATFTDNMTKVRSEFRGLRNIFESVKEKYFGDNDNFNQLSMGMSNDYKIAIEEGSTLIRIGSLIFKE
jgi:pyridoxal phosphate enzyme (YggS family)